MVWNVGGAFDKVMGVNDYAILFELYNKELYIWCGMCIWQVTCADSNA
jgi:hypothetical protein